MKVNFIIIGAARSATTSLSSLLSSHPSISFSKPKEPQFFSKITVEMVLKITTSYLRKKKKLCMEKAQLTTRNFLRLIKIFTRTSTSIILT